MPVTNEHTDTFAQANKQIWQKRINSLSEGWLSITNPRPYIYFFTRLHPSTFPYSILVSHSGDEAVSIATTQELGVGALAPKLAEKDGLH